MHKLVAIAVYLAWGSALAAPVTWTLDNVTFYPGGGPDGGTISGTFVYDATLDVYSDVALSISGFATDGPVEHGSGSANELNASMDLAHSPWLELTPPDVYLRFSSALTNAGGTVAIVPGVVGSSGSWIEQCNSYTYDCFGSDIVSGTVSAVPVPAAVWLFGSALAGLGWLRRKRSV